MTVGVPGWHCIFRLLRTGIDGDLSVHTAASARLRHTLRDGTMNVSMMPTRPGGIVTAAAARRGCTRWSR